MSSYNEVIQKVPQRSHILDCLSYHNVPDRCCATCIWDGDGIWRQDSAVGLHLQHFAEMLHGCVSRALQLVGWRQHLPAGARGSLHPVFQLIGHCHRLQMAHRLDM
jgi:hypothetical protein